MNETLAEETASLVVSGIRPVKRKIPQLESRAVKNKQTETKSRCGFGLTRHLISGALCLAVISLICSSASAQNLFATDYLSIDEFTPDGVQSTFASGLNNPLGLAFDRVGNLFVADTGTYTGTGAVYKFTPAGVRTTFASGLNFPFALAFDSQGNLFVTADETTIYKFTPTGVRTTFATVQLGANGLAFDRAGNLFVTAGFSFVNNENLGTVYKFTPAGVRTTFASGLNSPFALAFDSQGNLFVADQGYGYDVLYDAAVYKFTPAGLRSTVASENDQDPVIPSGLAIDSADNLFVSTQFLLPFDILKFTPSGVRTTFVADNYAHTAMAFQPTSTPTPSPTPTPGVPPIVATNPATNVASFSATLNGTVNPNGLISAVHFEYGSSDELRLEHGNSELPRRHDAERHGEPQQLDCRCDVSFPNRSQQCCWNELRHRQEFYHASGQGCGGRL